MDCQPCFEQNKMASAVHWCKDCEEALCDDCTLQHKAFKVSKNHVITKLTEQAETCSIKPDNGNQTVCSRHPDKGLEYLCPVHQIPICLYCKREDHKECLGVEKIEDAVDNGKVLDVKRKVSTAIQDHILHLETHLRNGMLNFNCLVKEKEQFLETMTANRRELNDQLDELENKIKQKMVDEYKHKAQEIESVIAKLYTKINSAKQRLSNLVLTNMDKSIPLEIRYLDLWKMGDVENALREKSVDMNKESFVIPEYKFSYHVSEDKREIHVTHFIATKAYSEDLYALELDRKSQSECGSSVIELEPEETQVSNKGDSERQQAGEQLKELPNTVTDKDLKLTRGTKDDTVDTPACRNEACSIDQSYSGAYDYQVPPGNSFRLKHSFSIHEGRDKFCASDIKVMLCYSELAIIDVDFPRFIIYTKNGQKMGYTKLPGMPDSIALIDKNRAAVTLLRKKSVAIINTEKLSIMSVISVYDECKGLLFYNNLLIVNCTTNGLRYITTTGQLIKYERTVNGDLYLHADKMGNVYSAKVHSKSILVYNMNGRKQSTYHFNIRGLEEPIGLTTSRDQILFVSCYETNTIFCKKSRFSSADVVLDQKDGINRPMSIEYDDQNDELIIVNDNGESIYIFERV